MRYDAATLATNTKRFAELPTGDRIALLDDQWALVGSGQELLPTYLALAQSMDGDLDVRAWEQVEHALGAIEYDERGAPEHNAFAAYARSLVRPAFDQIGWDAKTGETPDVQELRSALLEDLGMWEDPAVIAEARRRFDAFVQNHSSLKPDDQAPVLDIVARNADAGTFEKLHALAKGAQDNVEILRDYSALMLVRDDSLAAQAAQIALSSEIPPQAESERIRLIEHLARQHQKLAWTTFCDHYKTLLAPHSPFEPYFIAQFVPQIFWSGVPLDQLDAWVRGHVPREMADTAERGMQTALFKLKEKQVLVSAADAYLHSGHVASRAGGPG